MQGKITFAEPHIGCNVISKDNVPWHSRPVHHTTDSCLMHLAASSQSVLVKIGLVVGSRLAFASYPRLQKFHMEPTQKL